MVIYKFPGSKTQIQFLFIIVCVHCAWGQCSCAVVHMWRPEINLESVLHFYMGLRRWAQVIGFLPKMLFSTEPPCWPQNHVPIASSPSWSEAEVKTDRQDVLFPATFLGPCEVFHTSQDKRWRSDHCHFCFPKSSKSSVSLWLTVSVLVDCDNQSRSSAYFFSPEACALI